MQDPLARGQSAASPHRREAQAIAEIEKSRALVKAREAVRHVVELWNRDDVSPEIAEAQSRHAEGASKQAEAGWQQGNG